MYEIFEKLCKEKGITPYRVCKDTGLTTATLSNWKAGRYVPKADKMQIIADYFGVSLEYLRTGKGPELTSDAPYYINDAAREMAQFMYDHPEYKVLFDASRKVNKEDIEFVKEIIERFSGNNK